MSSDFFFLPQNVSALIYEDKVLTIAGSIIVPEKMLFEAGSPDVAGMRAVSTTRTLDKQFEIKRYEVYHPLLSPFRYYTFFAEGFVISFAPGVHNCNFLELDDIIEKMEKDGIEGQKKVTFHT